jgi:hypothetical protein
MARVESPQSDPLRSLAPGAAGGSPCPKADLAHFNSQGVAATDDG